MKKRLFVSLLSLALFVSCKKDDTANLNNPAAISVAAVSGTVTAAGTWRITSFVDNGDETAHFTGYAFTFSANGGVSAIKNGTTVTGNWSSGIDDSQTKLFLTFSAPADFAELSDDWHVIERTDNRITLQDISGGNGGTDTLVFEKN